MTHRVHTWARGARHGGLAAVCTVEAAPGYSWDGFQVDPFMHFFSMHGGWGGGSRKYPTQEIPKVLRQKAMAASGTRTRGRCHAGE